MTEMEATTPISLIKFMAAQQKKKKMMITGLLLSVSIFSFIFSYYAYLLIYSHKNNIFSSNTLRLLNRALSKNCVFLICNCLLVFLAKTSGFVPSHSAFDLNDMLQKQLSDILERIDDVKEEMYLRDQPEKKVSIFIAESDFEDVGREDDQKELVKSWVFQENGEELIGEDGSGNEIAEDRIETELSTQEMNQKFEDFIKKMKEEIIISESSQQLAIVN